MTFRIGLIGNRAHQMTYGPIFAAREDCRIVAAAEHHPEKAKPLEDRFGVQCTADYDAVLENPEVDIVSIATDFYLKRTLVQKAVACGKHVLVDKALARTVREAREIVTAADGAEVKVVLAYPFRFMPALRTLSQAIRGGECGRIASFSHHFIRQFPDGDLMAYVSYPTPSRVNGGGELINLGSHPVDYLCSLFGLPKRVYCHMETAFWGEYYDPLGTEDMATLFCEYEGFAATIVTGRNKVSEETSPVNTVEATCQGRWMRTDGDAYAINGAPVEIPPAALSPSAACVQHLIECVVTDSQPEVGLPSGLAVAELTTAGYQSAATGNFVTLPLEDETHPLIGSDEQVIDTLLD